MSDDEKLEQFLDLCQRMYERMKREGSWPWKDSQDFDNMIESKDNKNDV